MSSQDQTSHAAPPERTPLLSVVAPAYNEEDVLDAFFARLLPILERTGLAWELVIVDDGSRDRTAEMVRARAAADGRIKLLCLARNFGKDAALTCGLDHASGDAAIPIDVDLQDPPEVILELVAAWRNGYQVVNAVRADRSDDGWLKRMSARWFYRVMIGMLGVRMTPDAGDFRLLDRRVLSVVRRMREQNRFMKGLLSWPGFRTTAVRFVRPARAAGTTKWNWWRLWNFALNGIVGYSSAPLKIWFYLGFTVALAALAYAAVIVVQKLVWGNPVAGYPSLMVAILFMGGVQLMSLGVIGEYLARIFDEVKGRPIYVVGDAANIAPRDEFHG